MRIALSSSRGPSSCDGSIYPNVVAPGINVKTADLTFGGANPDPYAFVSGASIAAPHVSGAMALLLSADPGLNVSELERALEEMAVHPAGAAPDNVYGYGMINVLGAYGFLDPFFVLCSGDANGDGNVDGLDLFVLSQDLGATDCFVNGGCGGDVNGDSTVTVDDVGMFAGQYSRTDCSALN